MSLILCPLLVKGRSGENLLFGTYNLPCVGAEHVQKKPSGQENHSIRSKQALLYRYIFLKINKDYSDQKLNTEWK